MLAFLHDVGKAGAGFYAKALDAEQQAGWRKRSGAGFDQQGHTRVVAPLLGHQPDFDGHRQALGIQHLRDWAGPSDVAQEAVLDLWLAAVSHHGEPLSAESLYNAASAPHPTWTCPIAGYDPLFGLAQLRNAAMALWPDAFEAGAVTYEPRQPLIHAFAGLVSLADWIGSDTRHFPYDLGPQDHHRWPVALQAARKALRDMRIDMEDIRVDLRHRSPSFSSVFGFSPKEMQQAAADAPMTSPVVLEAETGSGKTEAALWRFKTLFEAGEVDALCFLLPTRVAATSISQRIDAFIERLFPDPTRRPNTVLAVPSYLRANAADGKWLAPFRVLWPDREVGDPLFWAAENSKRYFAAAAASGTIDQFLLSTLQTRHAHLRGSVLLRSLVVVDEVHASDPYMRALLVKALQRHQAAGGHALLLSATLTRDLRNELLRTAPAPRARFGQAQPAASDDLPDDYPRISTPSHTRTFGKITHHKRIQHQLQPWMLDPAAVASCAAHAALAGARVLVLRNTVRQAVATQQALELLLGADHPTLFRCNGVVALHHGRYALTDRRALDARVGEVLGKGAAMQRQAMVLCATQTVEISVDCDADFMITDLAPMDVLLQRLGRLHRHAARDEAGRPDGYDRPRCVVLTPAVDDLGSLLKRGATRGLGMGRNSAYPDLLALQATLNALQDRITFPELDIPTHNRELVERSCGRPSLDALAQQLGEPWIEHMQELHGQRSAQSATAMFQCIDWSKPWREALAGELSTAAKTRLGLDGIDLILPLGQSSPFGNQIDRLTMPAWMLPSVPNVGAAAPPQVEDLASGSDGLRFSVRGRGFSYTRLGLARTDA